MAYSQLSSSCILTLVFTLVMIPNLYVVSEVNQQIKIFQALFEKQRGEHKSAVQTIMSFDTSVKQYNMVKLIAEKVFEILEQSQIILREAGYVPGMDFPEDERVREALSQTLENTAFMGELLLHLPDVTHNILKSNKPWELLFTWGIFFTSESKFLDKNTSKFIYLVSQEMGVAEKDPLYVNPYAKQNTQNSKYRSKGREADSTMNKKKKPKKAFKKGPQLSRSFGDL
ncbi:hypothetical protein SK128_016002 [Halocaridina rubra]|uniref:Coiled-coil domain-containing protein 134 n=1 Tax=Halocaridina rubra TaxID=373956 RepID=A0AAN8X3C0_HALRR